MSIVLAMLVCMAWTTCGFASGENEPPVAVVEEDVSEHHEDQDLDGGGEPVFVTPPALPTYVEMQLTLLRIAHIDPPSERFPTAAIECFLEADWIDHRLAFDPQAVGVEEEIFLGQDAEFELERIWWPDVIVQNELHKRVTEDMELTIRPDGRVCYKERFSAVIPLAFDLHKFPFDSQEIGIYLESFSWDDKSLKFKHGKHMTGISDDLHLQEWEVTYVGAQLLDVHEARGEDGFSELELIIKIKRYPWHHVKTIIIPLAIILLMLCIIVYSDLDKRIEFILIALLSLVAFHGIIAEDLPKLSEIIFLDVLILMGYAIAMFALLEAVLAQRFIATGQAERAERMERTNRKLFPYVFALIVLGGFAGYIV